MNPLERYQHWWQGIQWDTPEYWAKQEASKKLRLACALARKDRPRRKSDRKRSKASRRRNRA